MSIAAHSVGEAPIGAQPEQPKDTKPPRRRLAIAKADAVMEPEAR
jgi:hypothetical protein